MPLEGTGWQIVDWTDVFWVVLAVMIEAESTSEMSGSSYHGATTYKAAIAVVRA